MATTKRAQYRFVVKEGPTEAREVREGVVDIVADPFIVAEPYGTEPESEHPLQGSDFLSFDLKEGISLDEAEHIARFLNDRVLYIAITRFGDIEDARRDVRQSKHVQGIDQERFSMVISLLRDKLAAGDIPAAIEALTAVESVAGDLVREWAEAISRSQAILDAFGQSEDPDA